MLSTCELEDLAPGDDTGLTKPVFSVKKERCENSRPWQDASSDGGLKIGVLRNYLDAGVPIYKYLIEITQMINIDRIQNDTRAMILTRSWVNNTQNFKSQLSDRYSERFRDSQSVSEKFGQESHQRRWSTYISNT